MDILNEIQTWYRRQCNGDWEHIYGITIETLDNPGWYITIDLENTNLEKLDDVNFKLEIGEDDWYLITIKEKKFIGTGDALKLGTILEKFVELIRKNEE